MTVERAVNAAGRPTPDYRHLAEDVLIPALREASEALEQATREAPLGGRLAQDAALALNRTQAALRQAAKR